MIHMSTCSAEKNLTQKLRQQMRRLPSEDRDAKHFYPIPVMHETFAGQNEESIFSAKAAFRPLKNNLGTCYPHNP